MSPVEGGYLVYDSTKQMPRSKFRDDLTVLGIPLTEMCNREYTDARQRQFQEHHVPVPGRPIDIDFAEVEKLIAEQFRGKDS